MMKADRVHRRWPIALDVERKLEKAPRYTLDFSSLAACIPGSSNGINMDSAQNGGMDGDPAWSYWRVGSGLQKGGAAPFQHQAHGNHGRQVNGFSWTVILTWRYRVSETYRLMLSLRPTKRPQHVWRTDHWYGHWYGSEPTACLRQDLSPPRIPQRL